MIRNASMKGACRGSDLLPRVLYVRRFSLNPPQHRQLQQIPLYNCRNRPTTSAVQYPQVSPFPLRRYLTKHSFLNGNETIYALSTAPGRAAIAIVRISGPAARGVSIPSEVYLTGI